MIFTTFTSSPSMILELSQRSRTENYFTLTQTVIPRPIAWLLTENEVHDQDISYNLAPFSFFNAVCSDPPLLMVSISHKAAGGQKDTLYNLKKNQHTVVHIAEENQYQLVENTALMRDYGDSEITAEAIELTQRPGFTLPTIASCPVAYMCRLKQIIPLGQDNHQNLVLLRADSVYVDDRCITYDNKNRMKIDSEKVAPLSRLSVRQYSGLSDIHTAK